MTTSRFCPNLVKHVGRTTIDDAIAYIEFYDTYLDIDVEDMSTIFPADDAEYQTYAHGMALLRLEHLGYNTKYTTWEKVSNNLRTVLAELQREINVSFPTRHVDVGQKLVIIENIRRFLSIISVFTAYKFNDQETSEH